MLKKAAVSLVAVSALFLAGCGSKLDGTYATNMASYTFKGNGTVVMDSLVGKVEMKYELDGKDVRIITPQGVMIMTLLDENTIQGPLGMKLVKQQ